MSVINSIPLIAAGDDGYQISRSVRLRSSASAYFNRTPSSATNRKTWTWSGWHKRGKLASDANLLAAFITNTNQTDLSFSSGDDKLYFTDYQTTAKIGCSTNAVFRDPSAWYHIILVVDTTQATNSNGIKIYINGVQQTLTFTAYTQNQDTMINSANVHQIGARYSSSPYYQDGYLTEINFIDGQALTPSSFGENDAVTGVWKPKRFAGSYGTNGFYLNFSDNSAATAAAIGKDSSGNGNNWTPNNISVTSGVTYDSMLDTPTPYADGGNGRGNYAVWNPVAKTSTTPTITNGNLQTATPASGCGNTYATMGIPSSGKWYWEVTFSSGANSMIGVAPYSVTANGEAVTGALFYYSDGRKFVSGTGSAYGASYTTNDIIGVAADADTGAVTFYKNGTSQGSISVTLTDTFPSVCDADPTTNAATLIANFGQRPFSYTPPTGFKALNTQNLPAGSITTSGSFTGNASADGPFVYLNGVPTAMTINGNAVTFATHVDKTANGFKLRTSSSSYNASGSNTYSITTTGAKFKYANSQVNP